MTDRISASTVAVLCCFGLIVDSACRKPTGSETGREYRRDMQVFVQRISAYARQADTDFIVVVQNGHQVLTTDGAADGAPAVQLIAAIDGAARESLLYGYDGMDAPTGKEPSEAMLAYTETARRFGLSVLIIDYCSSPDAVTGSYQRNAARGYISFAANRRALDAIPPLPAPPYAVHGDTVSSLSEARNFLYLINPGGFADKRSFLAALAATDHDLLIVDLFFGDEALTREDVAALKRKSNGGDRLVLAYMSIGEAEDYRYYFDPEWIVDPPAWLEAENPDWVGNYKVRYWHEEWQDLVMGDDGAYLDRILRAGFDGTYLDIIDAFQYFEERAAEPSSP